MTAKDNLKKMCIAWLSKFEQMDHWDLEDDKTDLITSYSYVRWVHPEGFNVGQGVRSTLTKAGLRMLEKGVELWD